MRPAPWAQHQARSRANTARLLSTCYNPGVGLGSARPDPARQGLPGQPPPCPLLTAPVLSPHVAAGTGKHTCQRPGQAGRSPVEWCPWPGLWGGRWEQRGGQRLPRREAWQMGQEEPPPAGVGSPRGWGGAHSPVTEMGGPGSLGVGGCWPWSPPGWGRCNSVAPRLNLMMDKDVRSLSHGRPELIISF